MDTYYTLGRALVALVVAFQCASFAVAIWAVRKHRRRCFAILSVAGAFGLVYSILAGIPFFTHLSLQAHILLARALLILVAIAAIIGLWGWILVVRTYRDTV